VGWCENFTSLAELNILLPPPWNATICLDLFDFNIITDVNNAEVVYLKANEYKGLVNDQLDMNRFFSSAFPTQYQQNVFVNLIGFNGLDLNLTFQNLLVVPCNIEYIGSSIDLYMNGVPIVMSSDGGRTCDETQLAAIFKNNKMNFSVFNWKAQVLTLFNIKQSHGALCALAFKNVNLESLTVIARLPKFFSSKSNVDMSGTSIYNLVLSEIVIEQLDLTVLHPQVFASLFMLSIYGCSIRHIQPDLFKNLPNLQTIILNLYNLKGFIHGNGIEWMRYLGSNSSTLTPEWLNSEIESTCDNACQKLLNSLFLFIFREEFDNGVDINNLPVANFQNLRYTFPDADFCTFANFSFNKLIVAAVNSQSITVNCSCSMLWLLKNLARVLKFSNNSRVQNVTDYANTRICNARDSNKFFHAYNACDFTSRLQNCALLTEDLVKTKIEFNDQYFQLYAIQSYLSQANNFLSSGFNIGVSVFALVTNLANAAVIVNARRHHKAQGPVIKRDNELNSINEAFFTYMLVNAFINFIFSLAFLLRTCISCVPTPVNEMYVNVNACVIADMCVTGLMSVMKLMGNYTYLLMTMNRYLLVGEDHVKWIEKSKSKFKIPMCIAIFCSSLLSLVSVYQVYYFEGFNFSDGDENNSYFYYHSYLFGRSSSDDSNTMINSTLTDLYTAESALPAVFFLTIVHDIVSYFIFCFFNLALDVMTVLKLKESLEKKARLSSTNKQDEQMRAERRSVIMVVLNSLVNILLRLPELLAIVFFIAVSANPNHKYLFRILCYNFGQCLAFGEISNSFVVLSLSFNIFFYYFFNKTFKFAFHLFFCGKKSNNKLKK
jgi:hypothetical protein